ncbi:ATP-dependent nuclease [Micromonospora sp. WMMD558]|uniref:ATP-dependent nuclease n=1 Tax=Micromonospora sp. WMMD558 TaxID=3403462 RepID=UPI003BF5894B
MRIERLKVENIGGLPDLDLEIPQQQMVAFAGANGTGKSKLLASLLTPWITAFPVARSPDVEARVSIRFAFDSNELDQFEAFDRENNWRRGRPPERVAVTVMRTSTGNVRRDARAADGTPHPSIVGGLHSSQLLKRCPSLNVIYLPAERRFHPSGAASVDLSQLSPEAAVQKIIDARASSLGPGHLDDQEFETYAKALCVAGFLPSEDAALVSRAQSQWERFRDSVDSLLFPKKLLPLTAENPSSLRIGLPDGSTHEVSSLSSGERQALIIISRVFRAGEGHSLVAIDEPDAYLHPSLSARLLRALRPGLETGGRLIVATHSPSVLDALPTAGIVRLRHSAAPAIIEDEVERLDLYREAGFRASSLTQADLLVLTEGEFDATVLPLLVPEMASASIQSKGGREPTIKALNLLAGYGLPIMAIVDSDVLADDVPAGLRDICHVWPVSDIEAALLSDPAFLQAAVDGKLVRESYSSVDALQKLLTEQLIAHRDQAVSEYAQRLLRGRTRIIWPSPRGGDALERLRRVADLAQPLTPQMVEEAIVEAEAAWDLALPSPWTMVRGKWIIGAFVAEATYFRSKDAFVNAVAARQPELVSVEGLRETLRRVARSK